MRGTLIERCDDGVRSVVATTCAPAVACDTYWADDGFAYDGRTAPVPVGQYAHARASDGESRRIKCVANARAEVKEEGRYEAHGDPAGCEGRIVQEGPP
jgi:hypothetical protein